MRIIEGKQAVLKPYRTEKECVLPRLGQAVTLLEPAACPVREPRTMTSPSVTLADAQIQVPKDCVFQRISETEMQEPVEHSTQEIPNVRMHSAAETVLHIDDISVKNLQTTRAQMIPATSELEQMMEETEPGRAGMKKKKWFADTILRITNLQ